MRATLAVLIAPLVLAGCAAERTETPPTLLPAGVRFKAQNYDRAGMRVSLPNPAVVVDRKSPEVFRATYADWYVAGFAYKRREELPRTSAQLKTARHRLVAEVRRRNRKYKLISSRLIRSSGSPAIELVGDQVLDKRRLRTRSLHVYKGHSEYVLELAAPVAEFPTDDRRLFDRVVGSLRVTGKPR